MVEKLAVTKQEAAEMLGVSPRTVQRMVATKQLPRLQLEARRVLIPVQAIKDLVNEALAEAS